MDRLRFLQIPKTAGSTFSRILRNQYKGENRFRFIGDNIEDRKRFSSLTEKEKLSITLFTGHAPVVSGVKEADEAQKITILRDPVSRVKSFCQYVSVGKSSYLLDKFPPESFNLDDFLYSNNSELTNLQSRMLINYERNGSELVIGTLSPEEIKAKALDNLFNKITCYGLQEYFDESLIHFSSMLGWRSPHYENMNKKNKRRLLKFENHHIDRIVELNLIDIEFYKAARERFLCIIESDEQLKKKIEAFKRTQKLASPIIKIYGGTGRYVKKKYRLVFGEDEKL